MDAPDVVCIGETMLMLAPPQFELLEESASFKVMSGGAESNVAIGVSRLGGSSGWVGKLPNNQLGKRIAARIRSQGVDISEIVWADEGRLGLFFFQWGAKPRKHVTIYDREQSAASTIMAEEVNWDYVLNSKWIHITGITPALSQVCYEFTQDLIDKSKKSLAKLSIDINYRSQLWRKSNALAAFDEMLPNADLITGTKEDWVMLLGTEYAHEKILKLGYRKYEPEMLVMTSGAEGAYVFDGKEVIHSGGYDVTVINRLGAGDAFVAGLLYGLLEEDLKYAIRLGVAMAALKLATPLNEPFVQKADIEKLLNGSGQFSFR